MRGFQNRRMQISGRGARSGDNYCRARTSLHGGNFGYPQCRESPHPLIVAHMQADFSGPLEGDRGECERGAARTGAQHHIVYAQVDQGPQKHAGSDGSGIGHGFSLASAAVAAARSFQRAVVSSFWTAASRSGSGVTERTAMAPFSGKSESEVTSRVSRWAVARPHANGNSGRAAAKAMPAASDRKSTRLNSSHVAISSAVFCLTNTILDTTRTIPALRA